MPILGTIASSISGNLSTSKYFQIATTTLSGTSSYTFSSIPQTYDHLELRWFAKDNRSPVYSNVSVRLNNDTGANYWYYFPDVAWTQAPTFGIYTDYSSGGLVAGNIPGSSSSDFYGSGWLTLSNYTNTNMFKYTNSVGGYAASGAGGYDGFVTQAAGMWRSTSAVTSLTFLSGNAVNFQSGTRVSLYGIKGS